MISSWDRMSDMYGERYLSECNQPDDQHETSTVRQGLNKKEKKEKNLRFDARMWWCGYGCGWGWVVLLADPKTGRVGERKRERKGWIPWGM